ncbi:MAG TPA: DUF2119 domain-containing protein [archaeon]|nr:DUF2119 domain-containing protein [archaeon]
MKRFGRGTPVRLFAGGLHGDEWISTSPRLERLTPPGTGSLLVMPKVSERSYLSTLDKDYYTQYVPHLLDVIIKNKPTIYLELHSYSDENISALTEIVRLEKKGVPAYIELESGILMGSVSPHIRKEYFSPHDLCISFEMPKNPSEKSLDIIDHLLYMVKECGGRDGFVQYMKQEYPKQASIAIKNYLRFYGHLY